MDASDEDTDMDEAEVIVDMFGWIVEFTIISDFVIIIIYIGIYCICIIVYVMGRHACVCVDNLSIITITITTKI